MGPGTIMITIHSFRHDVETISVSNYSNGLPKLG